jgi:hypothetical protein
MIELAFNTPLDKRHELILDAVSNKDYTASFLSLYSSDKENSAVFSVFDDALKIDINYTDEKGVQTLYREVRVNVSASVQQAIADKLNCSLLTTKLADLIWDQAPCKINPKPRPITSSTIAMLQHSAEVDVAIIKAGCGVCLVSTVGKHWVLDNKILKNPTKACNYGWHFTGGSTYQGVQGYPNCTLIKDPTTHQIYSVIQPNACFHPADHTDYSQTCLLVSREVIVNGYPTDIMDLFNDPKLSYLANNDGILKYTKVV